MFKTIGLLKRRPGMSVEEFRDYYENNHRVIGEKYLKGNAEHYARRYLTPYANLLTGEEVEPEYDVVLEVWYADRAAFDATVEKLTTPAAAKEIGEDEEQLFDRPLNRFFFVEECESDLTK